MNETFPHPGRWPNRHTVIFDLGGVLIDWNPRHLYRQLFAEEAAMEHFLAEICSPAWNLRQDAGRPWDEAVAELSARHPQHAGHIAAYRERWPDMLAGPIAGSVAILHQLRERGVGLYALTNWSQETFPIARERFPFLDWFEGILVSGEEGMVKPDLAIYRLLLQRYRLRAEDCVFIDDSPANVAAADAAGLHALQFHDPATLRHDLSAWGLLGAAAGTAP